MAQTTAHHSDIAAQTPANRLGGYVNLGGRAILYGWLLSFVLHAGALTAMFFLVFPFTPRSDTQPPVSHIDIISSLDDKPLPAPTRSDQTATSAAPDPLQQRVVPKPSPQLGALSVTARPELSIAGVGSGGGDFSEYGLMAGSGAGPEFFGLGGSARGARNIVYVVDRSGSMLDTFFHVREELKRSIGELRRSQKFHVIFFNAGVPLENPPGRLVRAIKAHREAFFRFLETVFPAGSTQPARAMRRALAEHPDLIYFLTDGAFDPGLLGELDRWNKNRKVKIFTIAYFDRSGAALLDRIAREHGGEFRFVSEHDIP